MSIQSASQRAAANAAAQAVVTEVATPVAEVTDVPTDVPTEVAEVTDVPTDVPTEVATPVAEDFFSQFMEEENEVLTKEDIIRNLLASGQCKLLKGLHVRNVVATMFDTHALLTFVVKEWVIGDVRSSESDAFGYPKIELGRTHNVQTSSYAIAGTAKDAPKTAIFATELVDNPQIANMLFAGGSIDVILQHVPAGQEYVNPFATIAAPTTFDRDKVIHHVVAVSFGEVGMDMYHARLMK